MYIINYTSALIFLIFAGLLAFIIFLLSFILFYQSVNEEKNSIYECGFVPFGDARNKVEIKFYLVSILFIVFDLEIAFLLPGVASLTLFGARGLLILSVFLLFVALGFIYE